MNESMFFRGRDVQACIIPIIIPLILGFMNILAYLQMQKYFYQPLHFGTPVPAKADSFSGPTIPNRNKRSLGELDVFPFRYTDSFIPITNTQ